MHTSPPSSLISTCKSDIFNRSGLALQAATRPQAIQKDGTWYTYGWDLTKNICEVFGSNGYINTIYTYTPYGEATASGTVTQSIQWSSEFNDSELGMIYYNYRHYNSADGRRLRRDEEELFSINLYNYNNKNPTINIDLLGYACDFVWNCQDISLREDINWYVTYKKKINGKLRTIIRYQGTISKITEEEVQKLIALVFAEGFCDAKNPDNNDYAKIASVFYNRLGKSEKNGTKTTPRSVEQEFKEGGWEGLKPPRYKKALNNPESLATKDCCCLKRAACIVNKIFSSGPVVTYDRYITLAAWNKGHKKKLEAQNADQEVMHGKTKITVSILPGGKTCVLGNT